MQYKKDEIKERIDAAALAVFAEKGYKSAKVSDISESAGISVGNIYRYYKSKDDIFYANVNESFIEEAKVLLAEKIFAMEGRENPSEIINFMVENRHKLIIVFEKSEGTKYEKAKSELVEFILMAVRKSFATQSGVFEIERTHGFTAGIIYNNLIDMVLSILKESADSKTVAGCLRTINTYHMFGIAGFLTQSTEQNSFAIKEGLYGYL
ncbi:MAG: TetR/AcrR family transcriptional regulator [Clostridia bacterium]